MTTAGCTEVSDYIPVRTMVGNQLHMFAGILARNPTRELRIRPDPGARGTTARRTALRRLRGMGTLRRTPVRCIGRNIRPAGKPVLPMNGNDGREGEFRHAPKIPDAAARPAQACGNLCDNRVDTKVSWGMHR